MLCSEATLVNSDHEGGVAVTLRCKCWSCEICQPFNRWKVVQKAADGKPNRFVTLTVNPNYLSTPDERAQALVRAWRTIRRRACKRYGYKSIPFIAVFEATKRGEPHLHILARFRWIDQRWLSEQCAELISAPNVDVRDVPTETKAAQYCAKYIGKDLGRFVGVKRFWTSLDWLTPFVSPNERPVLPTEIWVRHNLRLTEVEHRLIAAGFAVTRYPQKLIWQREAPT